MRVVAGALTVAFLASACGGDKEPLTRQQYVAQADAICKKFEDELDALEEPTNAEEVGACVADAHPVVEGGGADLKEP